MEVKWEERFALGSHLIDNQHKRLIQNINNLSKAIELGRPSMEVVKILEYLDDYSQSHFAKEEELMRTYKYREYKFHKKEHMKFKKDLQELKNLFSNKLSKNPNSLETAKSLQYELWVYFKEHLSVIDASLASFLKRKGVNNTI